MHDLHAASLFGPLSLGVAWPPFWSRECIVFLSLTSIIPIFPVLKSARLWNFSPCAAFLTLITLLCLPHSFWETSILALTEREGSSREDLPRHSQRCLPLGPRPLSLDRRTGPAGWQNSGTGWRWLNPFPLTLRWRPALARELTEHGFQQKRHLFYYWMFLHR